MKLLAAAVLGTAMIALPTAALAHCGGGQAGSAVQSCEEGVRVIRQTPLALPRISPTEAARLQIRRDRLRLDSQRAANDYALRSRQLDQRDREISQTDYLYRDYYSPLNRGFGTGFQTFGGVVPGFGFNGLAPQPRRKVRHHR